ncbi:enoyl-CoA hydratase-related protein [Nocardioides terrisoli]|uniref:enoyl-CoA hydratase-related protein n=1 Tax=Nocardioides terrisoli TaxID=3388267 RepID=UPI00287B7E6B|nr:enoyl-CoA hydratase-related protein [Nocardioides marmorisolisilvae]
MQPDESADEVVRYEIRGRVALVTLDRPGARNAVNAALATGLGNALERAGADPVVRSVVLTGSGEAFCAGADLKAIAAGQSIDAAGHSEWGFAGFVQHWAAKPVIAAVNGFARGGGTELALACDLVVASSTASFGLPEVRRGLVAAAGGLLRLQHQISPKRAMELALTGRAVDAATAYDWGLVNRVVEPDRLLDEALELAGVVASNAPTAVRVSKRMLHRTRTAGNDWDPSWTGEDPWVVNAADAMVAFGHPDAIEGPTAFAEKREPRWQD